MTQERQPSTQVAMTTSEAPKGLTTYQSNGQEVKLSFEIVRNYLTKGNSNVTEADLVQFISICKFNQLNPFLNEAYLVKYGNQPAQMITSKEALFKRAESVEEYQGIRAGIIVKRGGEVEELEGCFSMEDDQLLGGWAEVYRSDRKYPIVAKVSLSEYTKGQATWKEMPATMISKVAKVQALREAFPTKLGALYTAEEQRIDPQEVEFEELKEETAKETAKAKTKAPLKIEAAKEKEPAKEAPKKETSKAEEEQCPF